MPSNQGTCFVFWMLASLSFWSSASIATRPRWKRDGHTVGNGLKFPLATDANGRYVASIGMGNNNKPGPVQNFSFVLSTSSPYIAVAGAQCTTCIADIGSSSLYNTTLSETETALNESVSIQIGGGGMQGGAVVENCGLLAEDGSYWWYPNQTVVVAGQSSGVFTNGAAGMLGLGRSSGNASFIDTVFNNYKAWENLTIGISLNSKGSSVAGAIDLKETDPSLYGGEIKYSQVVQPSGDIPVNYPADWSLRLDSWTVDTGAIRTEHAQGGIAIVEPYFPEIRFPQNQALLFYRDVPGANLLNDTATGMTWSIPCKSSFSLDIIFGGAPFSVPTSQLVMDDGSGNCIGVVMGWDSPFVESYLLGQSFAQTVYIVYNANRNGTDSIGFAPRPDQNFGSDKLSSGAVAGISVGATLAFVLLLIIAFFWWRRRRAVKVAGIPLIKKSRKSRKHMIEPFTPNSATPMYNGSTAHGNRPYIIEQGPIGGDVGQNTALLSGSTPENSPQTTTMSTVHRRKAEEAGLLSANSNLGHNGGSMGFSNRPQSSHTTSGTTSDIVQHLAPIPPSTPGTPATPEMLTQAQAQMQTQAQNTPPTDLSQRHASNGATLSRHVSSHNTRASTTSMGHGNMLSPTSSQQIHYHIHLPPGATPAGFPSGSIIHEYADDEPAPEYSERPGSPESVAPTTAPNASDMPPGPPSAHPLPQPPA